MVAQDIQFTNTFGGETLYTMRNGGEPTSSADTTSINLDFLNLIMN